jgi:hypothetical protein
LLAAVEAAFQYDMEAIVESAVLQVFHNLTSSLFLITLTV